MRVDVRISWSRSIGSSTWTGSETNIVARALPVIRSGEVSVDAGTEAIKGWSVRPP